MHAREGVSRSAGLRSTGFFGTHARELAGGPFHFTLSRAIVPKEELPLHWHEDAHFILAVDPGYLSRAFASTESQGAGLDLIYNPPGTEHRDCFVEPGGRFLSIAVPAWLAPQGPNPLHLRDQSAQRSAAAILGFCARLPGTTHIELEERTLALLSGVAPGRPSAASPRWLARAEELIQFRATDQSTTVSGLAGELGIHPVYFARAYAAARGQGPCAAIQRARVNAATVMMLTRDMSLADIAFACGFADQSHLCRSLVKAFGAPPSAIRTAFA